MKTQGEIEAAVCEGIGRFEQEYMGRGPRSIHTHLFGDLLMVRLQGVLTAAEQQLVKTLPAERGRALLKQVQSQKRGQSLISYPPLARATSLSLTLVIVKTPIAWQTALPSALMEPHITDRLEMLSIGGFSYK